MSAILSIIFLISGMCADKESYFFIAAIFAVAAEINYLACKIKEGDN